MEGRVPNFRFCNAETASVIIRALIIKLTQRFQRNTLRYVPHSPRRCAHHKTLWRFVGRCMLLLTRWTVSFSTSSPFHTLLFIFRFFLVSTWLLLLLLHPFKGLFSRTTSASRYRKGETSMDLNEARNDAVWGWQWHQLDHMQTICTLLQTPNTSSLIYTGRRLFLTPNQQCQSTEGNRFKMSGCKWT